MALPVLAVRVAPAVARGFRALSARASANSAPIRLGRYTRFWEMRRRSPVSAALDEAEERLDRLRLAQSSRLSATGFGVAPWQTPSEIVAVPGSLQFEWENAPELMPSVSVVHRPLASSYYPQGQWSVIQRPPDEREMNRPRKDVKVWSSPTYNRMLAITNKTWGPLSEWMEFQDAFAHNYPSMEHVATALAVNQAVDYAFGVRASFLKKRVYHSGYWPLPVGYDMLSRLWR